MRVILGLHLFNLAEPFWMDVRSKKLIIKMIKLTGLDNDINGSAGKEVLIVAACSSCNGSYERWTEHCRKVVDRHLQNRENRFSGIININLIIYPYDKSKNIAISHDREFRFTKSVR